MEIEQIYRNVDTIILTHLMVSDNAMQYMQALGYNGFKRYHRYFTKELLCKHINLEVCYYDRYQKVLKAPVDAPIYEPTTLKIHLEKWKELLARHIQELGELNQEHFDVVGITNNVIEELVCCFMKKLEKVNKWIMRFNESNWNSMECHYVDDCLHKKMKEKEEGE